MKKAALLIALAAMLSGCIGLGGRKSSFHTSEDGRTVTVICQSDGRCTRKPDGTVEIDNRGPLGQVWAAATASLGKIYDKVKEPEVGEVKNSSE